MEEREPEQCLEPEPEPEPSLAPEIETRPTPGHKATRHGSTVNTHNAEQGQEPRVTDNTIHIGKETLGPLYITDLRNKIQETRTEKRRKLNAERKERRAKTKTKGRYRSRSKGRSRSQNTRPGQKEQTKGGKEHKEEKVPTSEPKKETAPDKERNSQRRQLSKNRDRRGKDSLNNHTNDHRSRSRARSRDYKAREPSNQYISNTRTKERQDGSYYGRNNKGDTSTHRRYQSLKDRHNESKWNHRDSFTKQHGSNSHNAKPTHNPTTASTSKYSSNHHDTFADQQCSVIKTTPIKSNEEISVKPYNCFTQPQSSLYRRVLIYVTYCH